MSEGTGVPNTRQPKNSPKTAEKGATWLAVKQPEEQPKDSYFHCFRVFGLFFRLFFGCLTASHSAPFSAVFGAVFGLSGIWHLCRWPQRLQFSIRFIPECHSQDTVRGSFSEKTSYEINPDYSEVRLFVHLGL